MTTHTVTLDRLQQIAHEGRHEITVDAVRKVAYLRRGRVRYVAPLEEVTAK